ncbi:MAG: T9SS type A sorting domain-containing protein [Bacteroidales bacterium]|nr:T9SS type A sorting domain-containing protein [Bacteroidales bacterium]
MKKIIVFLLIINSIVVTYSQNFNYDLKYHRMELEVNPSVNYVKGKITTYFSPLENSFNEISFELVDEMMIDSILFRNQDQTYTQSNDYLNIQLSETLSANELDSIFVYYQGEPDASGFGSFITDTHNGVPIMWTLSEPYGAKSWWPCKQVLNDKADSLDMFVTTPIGNRVAGNGLIVGIDTLDDQITVHWKHRYPITAYLVAFAVTNYDEYYDYVPVNDTLTIPILNYVYPEDLSYAQANTPDLIDVFQFYCDSFRIYPFWEEKYGHAQFNWGGGMEHQTMTFLGDFNHYLMSHELAHQWFGDYITCGSWADIWINEGFAVYLEGMTAEQGLAPYSWEEWKEDNISTITDYPGGSVYCDDTTSVSRIFNYRLTYIKGGMIIHTLRWVIGDEAFFNGMRSYMNDPELAYGHAKAEDYKLHMENACNCDLTNFFNDWYYGQGYPIYNLYWSQNNEKSVSLTINQTQSYVDVDFFELPLPIKFSGQGNDTLIIFDNFENNQNYLVNLDFTVENIVLDPENWIITKNTTVSRIINSDSDMNVIMMPNPANDLITINFPIETFVTNYSIYDSNGKEILQKTENKQMQIIELHIDTLKTGNYIMRIETSNGTVNEKFIKQ